MSLPKSLQWFASFLPSSLRVPLESRLRVARLIFPLLPIRLSILLALRSLVLIAYRTAPR